jgi:hypothetical protein
VPVDTPYGPLGHGATEGIRNSRRVAAAPKPRKKTEKKSWIMHQLISLFMFV